MNKKLLHTIFIVLFGSALMSGVSFGLNWLTWDIMAAHYISESTNKLSGKRAVVIRDDTADDTRCRLFVNDGGLFGKSPRLVEEFRLENIGTCPRDNLRWSEDGWRLDAYVLRDSSPKPQKRFTKGHDFRAHRVVTGWLIQTQEENQAPSMRWTNERHLSLAEAMKFGE